MNALHVGRLSWVLPAAAADAAVVVHIIYSLSSWQRCRPWILRLLQHRGRLVGRQLRSRGAVRSSGEEWVYVCSQRWFGIVGERQCLWLVLHPGGQKSPSPRSFVSGDFMCVRVCTHHLKIVTSALQRVARDGSGKWLWRRWPSSARTTAQILLWFTLTVTSVSQVVVVVSSSTAASPALGELESIPAVFKRRWGKILDLWPVYLRAT